MDSPYFHRISESLVPSDFRIAGSFGEVSKAELEDLLLTFPRAVDFELAHHILWLRKVKSTLSAHKYHNRGAQTTPISHPLAGEESPEKLIVPLLKGISAVEAAFAAWRSTFLPRWVEWIREELGGLLNDFGDHVGAAIGSVASTLKADILKTCEGHMANQLKKFDDLLDDALRAAGLQGAAPGLPIWSHLRWAPPDTGGWEEEEEGQATTSGGAKTVRFLRYKFYSQGRAWKPILSLHVAPLLKGKAGRNSKFGGSSTTSTPLADAALRRASSFCPLNMHYDPYNFTWLGEAMTASAHRNSVSATAVNSWIVRYGASALHLTVGSGGAAAHASPAPAAALVQPGRPIFKGPPALTFFRMGALSQFSISSGSETERADIHRGMAHHLLTAAVIDALRSMRRSSRLQHIDLVNAAMPAPEESWIRWSRPYVGASGSSTATASRRRSRAVPLVLHFTNASLLSPTIVDKLSKMTSGATERAILEHHLTALRSFDVQQGSRSSIRTFSPLYLWWPLEDLTLPLRSSAPACPLTKLSEQLAGRQVCPSRNRQRSRSAGRVPDSVALSPTDPLYSPFSLDSSQMLGALGCPCSARLLSTRNNPRISPRRPDSPCGSFAAGSPNSVDSPVFSCTFGRRSSSAFPRSASPTDSPVAAVKQILIPMDADVSASTNVPCTCENPWPFPYLCCDVCGGGGSAALSHGASIGHLVSAPVPGSSGETRTCSLGVLVPGPTKASPSAILSVTRSVITDGAPATANRKSAVATASPSQRLTSNLLQQNIGAISLDHFSRTSVALPSASSASKRWNKLRLSFVNGSRVQFGISADRSSLDVHTRERKRLAAAEILCSEHFQSLGHHILLPNESLNNSRKLASSPKRSLATPLGKKDQASPVKFRSSTLDEPFLRTAFNERILRLVAPDLPHGAYGVLRNTTLDHWLEKDCGICPRCGASSSSAAYIGTQTAAGLRRHYGYTSRTPRRSRTAPPRFSVETIPSGDSASWNLRPDGTVLVAVTVRFHVNAFNYMIDDVAADRIKSKFAVANQNKREWNVFKDRYGIVTTTGNPVQYAILPSFLKDVPQEALARLSECTDGDLLKAVKLSLCTKSSGKGRALPLTGDMAALLTDLDRLVDMYEIHAGNLILNEINPTALVVRLCFMSHHFFGHTIAINCKSGKDRTGTADVELKIFAEIVTQLGRVPRIDDGIDFDPRIIAYRKILALEGGNLDIQHLNTGIGGSKLLPLQHDLNYRLYGGVDTFRKVVHGSMFALS